MKAAYRWLNEVTFNSYVHTVRWTALGVARVVIGTVPFYLFFCVTTFCSATTTSKTMRTVAKDLRTRFTQVARPKEESSLYGWFVTMQVIVGIRRDLD